MNDGAGIGGFGLSIGGVGSHETLPKDDQKTKIEECHGKL
jgi:hypothetical protein